MKSTGITRQVDTLGRVVLPKEIRRNLGLELAEEEDENLFDDEKSFTENDE